MRKIRKPSSAFRKDKEETIQSRARQRIELRERIKNGEKIEKTSFSVHGCNRCIECNGNCPI